MAELPFKLVSADSHIVEPPDLWTQRMEARFLDRAPRIVPGERGQEFVCEGILIPRKGIGLMATAKKYSDPDDLYFSMDGDWKDVPQGAYDPKARLAELDREGIEAEIIYTSLGLNMYSMDDREFQQACFRAFNDWLADFCSAAPSRLFGVAMIPPRDPDSAVRELERCAGLGLRGAMISIDDEEERGYNHPDYGKLWSAAAAHDMPISLHVAASTETFRRTTNAFVDFSLGFTPTMYTIAGMILDGVFDRHPRLKVISVENDAAWPLSMLERMDDRFKRDQGWAGQSDGLEPGKVPSKVFHEHVACSFMRDRTAIVNRDIIGDRNIMWGSDYPHFDGGWPNSADLLAEQFEGVPLDDQIRIGRANAIDFYELPLARGL
ncbi:MAG: amidohydrolase [Novosphingobium sp.]|nr:amidohydrolase [Novosphingobium sp.]